MSTLSGNSKSISLIAYIRIFEQKRRIIRLTLKFGNSTRTRPNLKFFQIRFLFYLEIVAVTANLGWGQFTSDSVFNRHFVPSWWRIRRSCLFSFTPHLLLVVWLPIKRLSIPSKTVLFFLFCFHSVNKCKLSRSSCWWLHTLPKAKLVPREALRNRTCHFLFNFFRRRIGRVLFFVALLKVFFVTIFDLRILLDLFFIGKYVFGFFWFRKHLSCLLKFYKVGACSANHS